jgi:hypothetical protein
MDNNEINFNDIVANLKGGKAQFIIQLSGIWFSAGIFGCSWKIVSAKFQQINMSKITFVADSDDEMNTANDEDDDDDISVDNDVIAKISQKQPEKKTLVEKQAVVAPVAASKPVHKPIPQEEEDDDEEDNELDNVEEGDEGDEGDDGDDGDEGEEEEEEVVIPVKVEEPVKPAPETKTKKVAAKKK